MLLFALVMLKVLDIFLQLTDATNQRVYNPDKNYALNNRSKLT